MGADDYMPVCKQWIEKGNEKYKSVIIADELKEDDAGIIGDLAWRNGTIIFAINLGFDTKFVALSMIASNHAFIQHRKDILEPNEVSALRLLKLSNLQLTTIFEQRSK